MEVVWYEEAAPKQTWLSREVRTRQAGGKGRGDEGVVERGWGGGTRSTGQKGRAEQASAVGALASHRGALDLVLSPTSDKDCFSTLGRQREAQTVVAVLLNRT